MGKTFAEKILAKKTGKSSVVPGEIVVVKPDYVMSHDNAAAISLSFKKLGIKKVVCPDNVVIVLDHTVPPSTEKYASNHQLIREFVKDNGIKNFFDVNTGICHQVLPEKGFAMPGKVILGSDSHTTTYGAFGAFSAGIGRTEVAAIWATGELWLKVPQSFKIVINGELQKGVTSKDLILYIIGKIGADGALYYSVEYSGETVENMSIESRMVLTNMAIEMGAKNGYIAPDEKTVQWLKGVAKDSYEIIYPDEDAYYEKVLEIDASKIEPSLAKPHTVDNYGLVTENQNININQALLGTCTNGKLEDLEAAAKILKGKKVNPNTRLIVYPASMEVFKKALKNGTIEILAEAGATIMNTGCGPCLGAYGGVLAPGEICISTANRNFKGRMGCKDAFVYLANPYTVAASAIEGKIADPRRYL